MEEDQASVHATEDMRDEKPDLRNLSRGQIRWLLHHCKQELFYMSFATIGIVVASGINLSIPFFVGRLMDSVQAFITGNTQLAVLVATLFGLVILMAFFNGMRHFFIVLTAERIVVRLRKELFQKILEQEIAFFDMHKTGELMNRLSADTSVLQSCVTINVETGCRCIIDFVGCIIILFVLSWRLMLIMLTVVPLVAIGAVIYLRFVGGLSRGVHDELAAASEIAQESISNIRSVRSMAQEYKQMHFYNDKVDLAYIKARALALAAASFTGGMMFMSGICVLLVLSYGGTLVLSNQMSIGQLTSFLLYSGFVAFSLSTGSGVYFEFLKALGATERVYDIVSRIPSIPISATKPSVVFPKESIKIPAYRRPLKSSLNDHDSDSDRDDFDHFHNDLMIRNIPNLKGELRFNNVSFTYPMRPDHEVLHGLDLDLMPGSVVALVGESGGGKSTCTQLIQRFYDPDSGSITLDGIDIRELDPSYLRNQIGVVSQEPYLFGTTIEDNIKYARDTASEDEAIEAAKQANAHNFIKQFPMGYQTMVGERGAQLSGGQKQRVAIAQAILKKPKILLLDEATSALDAESEYLVQQALERLMEGRTVLVIAHRLSTVRNADVVCVMSRGSIVEKGTHQELIESGGLYKQLVEKQLLGEKRNTDALLASTTRRTIFTTEEMLVE